MENPICLSRIRMPNELTIGQRRSRRHHTIDPFRIEQRLIHIRRAVVPLALHIEVVGALKRDRARAADFICADCTRERNLTRHASAAYDGFVEI